MPIHPSMVKPPRKCCPQCRSKRVARSHNQSIWGWPLVRWLGVRFYRCTDCWHRFRAMSYRPILAPRLRHPELKAPQFSEPERRT